MKTFIIEIGVMIIRYQNFEHWIPKFKPLEPFWTPLEFLHAVFICMFRTRRIVLVGGIILDGWFLTFLLET